MLSPGLRRTLFDQLLPYARTVWMRIGLLGLVHRTLSPRWISMRAGPQVLELRAVTVFVALRAAVGTSMTTAADRAAAARVLFDLMRRIVRSIDADRKALKRRYPDNLRTSNTDRARLEDR